MEPTPEQKLQAVVSRLAHKAEGSARAGSKDTPLGQALVFRPAARSLHVVGDSPLAAEFRRLVNNLLEREGFACVEEVRMFGDPSRLPKRVVS